VQGLQLRSAQGGQARLVPVRVDREWILAEELAPDHFSSQNHDVIRIKLQLGQLSIALGLETLRGKGRCEGPLPQRSKGPFHISGENLHSQPQTVVAREGIEASADAFDVRGHLCRASPLGVLGKECRQKRAGSSPVPSLMHRTARTDQPEMQIGKTVVRLDQKPGAIPEPMLYKIARVRADDFPRSL